MSPETFASVSIAWIDSIAGVITHLLLKFAIILALPAWMQIRARLDRHREDINTVASKVKWEGEPPGEPGLPASQGSAGASPSQASPP